MIKKVIGGYILGLTHNIKSINKSVIPKEGPVIIYSNHVSKYDHLLIGLFFKRKLYYVKGITNESEVLSSLKDGKAVLIFGALNKNYYSYFSTTDISVTSYPATIIPCAITGDYKFGKDLTVTFGDKLDLIGMSNSEIKTYLEEKVKELMLGRK